MADNMTGNNEDGGGEGAAVFDHAHLATYTMGEPEVEKEVLAIFLKQAGDCEQRLHEAGEAGDGSQWREAAHTLKGSSRGVGAFALGAMAERLERLHSRLLAISSEERHSLLADLACQRQRACQAIEKHLREISRP